MNLGVAFAHHFERGGKRRREHRRGERRLDDITDQERIDARPVGRLADQALQAGARSASDQTVRFLKRTRDKTVRWRCDE